MLVVGPADIRIEVKAADGPIETILFTSFDELDAWRRQFSASPVLGNCITEALQQLGVAALEDPQLTQVLNELTQHSDVPHLKLLISRCSSRRTFYRAWAKTIPETPAQFLRRVRSIRDSAPP